VVHGETIDEKKREARGEEMKKNTDRKDEGPVARGGCS